MPTDLNLKYWNKERIEYTEKCCKGTLRQIEGEQRIVGNDYRCLEENAVRRMLSLLDALTSQRQREEAIVAATWNLTIAGAREVAKEFQASTVHNNLKMLPPCNLAEVEAAMKGESNS